MARLTKISDIVQLLEKAIEEENWEIASEVLSLLYVHQNGGGEGLFDDYGEEDEW